MEQAWLGTGEADAEKENIQKRMGDERSGKEVREEEYGREKKWVQSK